MCYVKRAVSPSTQVFPIQESCDYVFPDACMTSEISWPEPTFIPSPISNPDFESSKRKSSVPLDLAVKRQRNKEAAARSREKKLNRLMELEAQVKILEDEKSLLSLQLAISESEKKSALIREEEYKSRIQKLEEYLYKKEF